MTEDIGIISSIADTIYSKSFVKKSVSLTANGYSTICRYVKPMCPGLISKPWGQIEAYVTENQSVVLDNGDYYVGNAVNFLSGVKNAHQNKEATDYILTAVEDLIKEDHDGYETADDDASSEVSENTVEIAPQCAFVRVKTISAAISQTLLKKASTITHIDLIKHTAFISKAPSTISEKIISYTTPLKALAISVVVEPCTTAYSMHKEDKKSFVDVIVFLQSSAATSFSDKIVVPVAAYLEVPNLHVATLKPVIFEYGMQKYESVVDIGSTHYDTVIEAGIKQYSNAKTLGSGLVATVTEGATYVLDMCTNLPVSKLTYINIPTSMYHKLVDTMSCLYAQYRGNDTSVLSDLIKSSFSKASTLFELMWDKINTLVVVPLLSKKKMD